MKKTVSALTAAGFVLLTSGGVANAQDDNPARNFTFDEARVGISIEFQPISLEALNDVRHARGLSLEAEVGFEYTENEDNTTTSDTSTTSQEETTSQVDTPRRTTSSPQRAQTPSRTTVTVTHTITPQPETTTTQVLPPEWEGYVYDGSDGVENTGSSVGLQDMQIDWNAPLAEQVVQLVKSQIGVPYVWGGNSWRENGVGGGLDCSSLVQQAFKRVGINLPRTTWDQINAGVSVPFSDIRPGDLVFGYNTGHVQVVTKVNPDGTGEVVHSPQPGEFVKTSALSSMPVEKVVRVL